ncbi:hypothetical protein [uncultured Kordia sp.]|uniref:hypothetical protein n=1 Tax=uncultured Kordia sp. TaxID=507699 RepID=UPI0026066712|nr:hypothetical protein [uncultured Kordia sp.]
MKKILILILTLLPFTLLGQHLKCCESTKEVESHLSGIWKLKSNSKLLFEYTFENDKGHLTEMQESDQKGEYIVLDDHAFVEVIAYEQGFQLKYTGLSGSSTVELKYLNSTRMILVADYKEVEFIKVSE